MDKKELKVGDVVQIAPESDKIFGGHFMVVTEPKPWGAQGYCEVFPCKDPENQSVVTYKGQAFYRCKFEDMEYIGHTEWMIDRESS